MGSVIGSCGHLLQPHDGPRGLGWRVVSEDDSGGEEHLSVCTICLLSEELGYVPEMEWGLRQQNARLAGEVDRLEEALAEVARVLKKARPKT